MLARNARNLRCDSPSYRPGSSLSQYDEKSRAPSAASRASTVLPPSRPGSSLEVTYGSSKTSRASTPLGGEFLWKADAPWPVREGGRWPVANSSLHADMDVARGSLAKFLKPFSKASAKSDRRDSQVITPPPRMSMRKSVALSARLQRNAADASEGSQADQDSVFSENKRSKMASCSPLTWGDSAGSGDEERAEKVRWSFQRTEEEIWARLKILHAPVLAPEYRKAVYLRRETDDCGDLETPLGKTMSLFESTGLANAPEATHPASLDCWPLQEGGCARTPELLAALEVINFYRWLCRVPRLRIDSFLQDLSNMVLHSLRRRSESQAFDEANEDIDSYVNSFEDLDISEGLKLGIITHAPSCSGAMRTIFSGLPHGPTKDGGPKVVNQHTNHDLELPEKAEASMDPYTPLLRLVRAVPNADGVESAMKSPASPQPRWCRVQGKYSPQEPPPALPPPPDSVSFLSHNYKIDDVDLDGSSCSRARAGRWRKNPAWGDTNGVVALRRRALDPRMRGVGFQRLGVNFCFWAPPGDITGMPEEEIHEEEEVEHDFLDPQVAEEVVVTKTKPKSEMSVELRKLRKWQREESWLDLRKKDGRDRSMEPMKLEDEFEEPGDNQNQHWKTISTAKLAFDFIRFTHDTLDVSSRTENYLKVLKGGKKVTNAQGQHQFWQEEDLEEPIMVCFPPPGLVPMQIFTEAGLMPWTISPDPMRLAPTLSCRVQVFRVRIDRQSGLAIRRKNEEVTLKNFCVDCADVGTAFCVIFTPDVTIHAGDEFEIVLTGLVDRQGPQRNACTLQYFVSFANFDHPDPDELLRSRAEVFLNSFGQEVLWEPAMHFHPNKSDLGGVDTSSDTKHRGRVAQKGPPGPRRGILKKPGMEDGEGEKSGRRRIGLKVRIEELRMPLTYDAKHPPSIGIVAHPSGQQGKVPGQYQIQACSNDVTVVFLVPSSTLLKGTLWGFLKSQAKWKLVPHAVFAQSFDVPRGPSDKKRQKNQTEKAPEKISEARDKHKTRVMMRIMLPAPGEYELRLSWGLVPLTAMEVAPHQGVQSNVARFDHPMRIFVSAREADGLRYLTPSLVHQSLKICGYAAKHPLAEQFGLSLLHPLHYRLRRGHDVKFLVHSIQAPLHKTDTSKSASAIAGQVYGASAEYWKEKTQSPKPLSGQDSDSDSDDEVAKLAEATPGGTSGGDEPVRATNEAFRRRIRNILAPHTRCGSSGSQIRIAAVVGDWERVEILSKRLLEPVGSSMTATPEVHEALLHIAEEAASIVQLVVFQVAADIALEDDIAARVLYDPNNQGGRNAKRHDNDAVKDQIVVLGETPRPNYWVLAQFYIDSDRHALPFDEDEMRKPPAPPPDAKEVIRNHIVGRPANQ